LNLIYTTRGSLNIVEFWRLDHSHHWRRYFLINIIPRVSGWICNNPLRNRLALQAKTLNYKAPMPPKTTNNNPVNETGYRGGCFIPAAAAFDVAAAEAVPDTLLRPATLSVGAAVAEGEKLVAELALDVGGGVGMFAVLEYCVAFAGVVMFVVVFRKPMTCVSSVTLI